MNQRLRPHWYSWEGIYTVDFTLEAVQRRCHTLGAALRERQWRCLVTHDTRFLSGQMARTITQLLTEQGVQVSAAFLPTTAPAVELAVEQRMTDCSLMVSAGNRPHWYNGLLLCAPTAEPTLLEPVASAPAPAMFPPALPAAEPTTLDIRTPYLAHLRETIDIDLIRRSSLTVFVDPMNGCASGMIPAVLGDGTQTKAVEINRETDPLFGRQPPQPGDQSLTRLRKLVRESDSHLGVGISADGRAIGVTDSTGELLQPAEVALLLAQYLARQHRLRGLVVVPPALPAAGLRQIEQASGLRIECPADPAARIAELMSHDRHSLLVGTTATGETTVGRWASGADALLVTLSLMEMLGRASSKLRPFVDELRGKLGSA